jgi:hypothetical protein
MKLKLVRPGASFSTEERKKLETFLADHWDRANTARTTQLANYATWEKNYRAIPAEKIRTIPWYNSSNFVVPLTRIFLDTFVARTLNIVYATRPLLAAEGFPRPHREALEYYINAKAQHDWDFYLLFRDLLMRGNKNGTAVVKTVHTEQSSQFVRGVSPQGDLEQEIVVTYNGPRSAIIPFEDIAFYPHTANYLHETVIRFHRLRYVEEVARQKWFEEKWEIEEKDLERLFKLPADVKRNEQQEDAGVSDPMLREFHAIECNLDWDMGGQRYNIFAILEETEKKLVDVYFNPYPMNWDVLSDYRPFPREDFIYGESMCELLQGAQEETSWIHNDRRNNSYLANAPVFKRRNGSPVPNPSTNWYPGKVFDLESMEDLEVMSIGRNYSDTLAEENWDLQLAERLSGIGALAQGYAGGMMGKRGIYNATGTLAIMSESNQRQDTNIRDARNVLTRVAKNHLMMQAAFGSDDPLITTFPEPLQSQVHEALKLATPQTMRYSAMCVKASDAGQNKEIARQNLMQLAGVVSNYGGAVQQMVMQLVNPGLNPGIRSIMEQSLEMMKWMAARLLRAFDEYDAEGVLPDARAAIQAALQPNGAQPGAAGGAQAPGAEGGVPGMVQGGAGNPVDALSREGLDTLLALPSANGGPGY